MLGHDVVRDYRQARSLLGVVPQELVFDPFFSVRETLRIQSGYFGLRHNDAWIDEILDNLDLTGKADVNMRRLSGGMKRRVLVAQALVHKPPVIVLDEPTAGVDVELRQGLWQFVRRLNSEGHTIILTTHYLEEAEALCGRIALMKQGRVIALDTTANLMAAYPGGTPGRCLRADDEAVIGFWTLFYKELLRFWKVAFQTVAAPVLTALLYLLIFGHVLDGMSRSMACATRSFLIPGLVMMQVLQNAFANSSSSLIQAKITGSIVFVLLPPIPYGAFFAAYVLASLARGLMVGVGVLAATVWFAEFSIVAPLWVLAFAVLGGAILGALGMIAGLWAEKFDQLAGLPELSDHAADHAVRCFLLDSFACLRSGSACRITIPSFT